ncbi:hypothetical protein ACFL59_09050, partial [Planctomycetota bacterium]
MAATRLITSIVLTFVLLLFTADLAPVCAQPEEQADAPQAGADEGEEADAGQTLSEVVRYMEELEGKIKAKTAQLQV